MHGTFKFVSLIGRWFYRPQVLEEIPLEEPFQK